MPTDFSTLKPVTVEHDPNEKVLATIKMKPGKKPSQYRMHIVDDIYTIDTTRGGYELLRNSDDVLTISISEKLSMIAESRC